MLKKLLKYEIVNIFKFLVIFYGIAMFFGLLTRLFLSFDNSLFLFVIGQICLGVTISMLFSIIINNLMRLWGKFRQNIYGDEAYLTHTLPINKNALWLSKFIVGLISIFVSLCIITLTIFIAFYSKENIMTIKSMLFPNVNGVKLFLITFLFIIILFLEFVNVLNCGYLGIILGHRKNNKKITMSVIFSFCIYIASQIIVILLICLVDLLSFNYINILTSAEIMEINILIIVAIFAIIFYLLVIGLGYYLSNKLLKKGVNVD